MRPVLAVEKIVYVIDATLSTVKVRWADAKPGSEQQAGLNGRLEREGLELKGARIDFTSAQAFPLERLLNAETKLSEASDPAGKFQSLGGTVVAKGNLNSLTQGRSRAVVDNGTLRAKFEFEAQNPATEKLELLHVTIELVARASGKN